MVNRKPPQSSGYLPTPRTALRPAYASATGVVTRASVVDDRPDRLALVHQIEALVDPVEWQNVGDQIVDVDLPVHVPVDDLRNVRAAACAAEDGAFPDAAGHELERTRTNLLSRACNADDHRYAPPAVAAFERLPHHIDVADALERIVGAATGEFHEVQDEVALDV